MGRVVDQTWWEELIEEDETGSNQDQSQILEGKVIVSRNPCTHPGDVRLL